MRRAQHVEHAGHWPREQAHGTLTLAYDERYRRRMRLTTDGGEDFLLDLPRAAVLESGDGLAFDSGGWIEVCAAPEPLIEVKARSADALVRIAWHVGNRHLPAQLLADRILLRDDSVVLDMLRRLGATVERVVAPFTPERGAYGSTIHHQEKAGDHHDH